MTRSLILLPLVVVIAYSSVSAQMSSEEAYRRLRERQMARLRTSPTPATAATTQPTETATTRTAIGATWFEPVGGLPDGAQWELVRDMWLKNRAEVPQNWQVPPTLIPLPPPTDSYVAISNGRFVNLAVQRMPRVLDSDLAHAPAAAKSKPGQFNGSPISWRVWQDQNKSFTAWTRFTLQVDIGGSPMQILVSLTLSAADEASLNDLISGLAAARLVQTHPPPLMPAGPDERQLEPCPDPFPYTSLGFT